MYVVISFAYIEVHYNLDSGEVEIADYDVTADGGRNDVLK